MHGSLCRIERAPSPSRAGKKHEYQRNQTRQGLHDENLSIRGGRAEQARRNYTREKK